MGMNQLKGVEKKERKKERKKNYAAKSKQKCKQKQRTLIVRNVNAERARGRM
jgi:hypothetical protein